MTSKTNTIKQMTYRWPKVDIDHLGDIPPSVKKYLTWLRRTSLCHISTQEYTIAKAFANRYAMEVYGLELLGFQMVEFKEAERKYKAAKNVIVQS